MKGTLHRAQWVSIFLKGTATDFKYCSIPLILANIKKTGKMSQVLINQTDQDLIEVDFFQHGQNHTETTLDKEILNGAKSYHFCVSSLSVPLKHVPIHPVPQTTQLFRVRRRFTGQVVNRNDRGAAVYAIYKEIKDLGAQPQAHPVLLGR